MRIPQQELRDRSLDGHRLVGVVGRGERVMRGYRRREKQRAEHRNQPCASHDLLLTNRAVLDLSGLPRLVDSVFLAALRAAGPLCGTGNGPPDARPGRTTGYL